MVFNSRTRSYPLSNVYYLSPRPEVTPMTHGNERTRNELRELTAEEVTFTVTTESDDIDPSELLDDRRDVASVRKRLDSGDYEAWCVVLVTVTWEGHKQSVALGACSLSSDYTADTVVSEHGMKGEALARLNEALADTFAKLSPLAR